MLCMDPLAKGSVTEVGASDPAHQVSTERRRDEQITCAGVELAIIRRSLSACRFDI